MVARGAALAVIAEAKKNSWTMAVAVVDTAGNLVYFERMLADNKIIGAIGVSGATSQQDGQCAKAGADALAKPHASK